jgi:hypothetical protein
MKVISILCVKSASTTTNIKDMFMQKTTCQYDSFQKLMAFNMDKSQNNVVLRFQVLTATSMKMAVF